MRNISSVVVLLALSACAAKDASTSAVLPSFANYSCPKLLPITGYSVEAKLGPDYTICTLTPQKPGLPPAEILVGGHWELPDNSRFAGFSHTEIGAIAWFYGTNTDSVHQRIAFISTGLEQPAEVQLIIQGGNLHEIPVQREALLAAIIAAGMRPKNSLNPSSQQVM